MGIPGLRAALSPQPYAGKSSYVIE